MLGGLTGLGLQPRAAMESIFQTGYLRVYKRNHRYVSEGD